MNLITRTGNILRRYPLSLIIIAAIIYLSLFNIETQSLPKVKNLDKFVHFCMYAGLCSIVWLEYLFTHNKLSLHKILLGAIVAPVLFSIAMELAQALFTEHRSYDWLDILFNILGIFAATMFSLYVTRPYVLKRRGKK